MKEKFWVWSWGVLLTLATFVSGFFSWFTPLPFFYIGRKYSTALALLGWLFVLLTLGFSYVFLLGLSGGEVKQHVLQWFLWLPGMVYYKSFGAWVVMKSILVYFSFNISLSLLLIWRSKKEKLVTPFVSQVALGTLFITVLSLCLVIGFSHFQDFANLLLKYSLAALDQVIVFNQSAGMSGEELVYIQQNKQLIAESFVKVLPGIGVSAVFFLVWINLYFARRLFGSLGIFSSKQELSLFHLAFESVWAVILALALFLLNLYIWKIESVEYVLLNLFIVFATLYFFQGFAIVVHFFISKKVSLWLRLLSYLLILVFIQPLGMVLMSLGFFDSWYDFRKLSAKGKVS